MTWRVENGKQAKRQEERERKKIDLKELSDTIKHNNIGIPEGEEGKGGRNFIGRNNS